MAFLGYYKGRIDGDLDTQASFDAITAFHTKHQQVATGFLEEEDKRYFSEVYQALLLSHYLLKNTNPSKQLQAALAELQFYQGAIDGDWGKHSKEALSCYRKTLQERDNTLTKQRLLQRLIEEAQLKNSKRVAKIAQDPFTPADYRLTKEEDDLLLQ